MIGGMMLLDKSRCLESAIVRPNYLLRRPAPKSWDLIQNPSQRYSVFNI